MLINQLKEATTVAASLSHPFQLIRIFVEKDGFVVCGEQFRKDIYIEAKVPRISIDEIVNPIALAVREVAAALEHTCP